MAADNLHDGLNSMRRPRFDKQLRLNAAGGSVRRTGFTLAELIVSMGILLLMLTMAGQVMSLTVRATGQAKAFTEVHRSARIIERALREDLRHVKFGNTIMVIQGNPINAYWTQEGKEADLDGDPSNGYLHIRDPEREAEDGSTDMAAPRADVLMFFTTREATNYVQYNYTNVAPDQEQAIRSGVQQVVYGHADLIEFDSDGDPTPDDEIERFPSDPTVYYSLPAEGWHLARRVVHLLSADSPPPASVPKWADATTRNLDEDDGHPHIDLLGNPAILMGKTDVMAEFDYEQWVITPMDVDSNITTSEWRYSWPEVLNVPDPPGAAVSPFARSMLDPSPPARLADRLGHYFMPNCASFKVEWALDPASDFVGGRLESSGDPDGRRQVFWFDPGAERPLATLEDFFLGAHTSQYTELRELFEDALGGDYDFNGGGAINTNQTYSLKDRFGGGSNYDSLWHSDPFSSPGRPNVAVFAAQRRRAAASGSTPGEPMPEDVFPIALRITVDLFDNLQRLERPIRHVMILPVGG